jgi:hypothetical protein
VGRGWVIGWVQIGAALHYERRVGDFCASGDTDGFITAGTAAMREGCVFEGYADVDGDGGVDAEDLVDAGLHHR